MEMISAKFITYKELMYGIHKEILQTNEKMTKNPKEKGAKDLNRCFRVKKKKKKRLPNGQ